MPNFTFNPLIIHNKSVRLIKVNEQELIVPSCCLKKRITVIELTSTSCIYHELILLDLHVEKSIDLNNSITDPEERKVVIECWHQASDSFHQ